MCIDMKHLLLTRAVGEDIDIIIVGQMRDLETIFTAMSADGTGYLVLATLYTNEL